MNLKKNQGFTLVEVIVSVTILAMGTLMFLTIINGSSALFNRGTDLKQSGIESSEVLEIFEDDKNDENNPIKTQVGTVTFGDGNGSGIPIDGDYKSVTINDVTFTLFVPKMPSAEN